MSASTTEFFVAAVMAVGLMGCGSSPEEQITGAIAEEVEAGLESASAMINRQTGGGVSGVSLDNYRDGDRRVDAEITFDSGMTREATFLVKKVDGRWQVR
jgi:hypothetical protein